MQSSSVLFSPFPPLFFPFFFFFKVRWKERVSEGARLTPVSVTAQAREVVGNDPLAAIWNCPPSWLGGFDWWCSFVQPYGWTSWRAGKEVLVPALGRGTKSLSETRSLREEEPLIQNYASFFTVLCTWDSLWHRGKVRPGLATRDGCAELWLKGRASSSALSAQCGLFTGQDLPLYTPPLFIYPNPKFRFDTSVHPWKQSLWHQEDRVCSAWAATETRGEESRAPRLGPLAVLPPVNVKQRQGQQDKSCNDHCGFPLSPLLLGALHLFPSEKSLYVRGCTGCVGPSAVHGYVDGLPGQSCTSP